MKTPKYKRILLKLSGEALEPANGESILDFDFIAKVAKQIKRCIDAGVQVGVIVGAGNIWRGRQGTGMERCRADHMGMLATAINALALQDALCRAGIDARAMTAVSMEAFAEPYTRERALHHLQKGRVVIFGCGTGNPFFSTDTGAVLRAALINADVVLLAKNVDGVYSADPKVDKNAVKYDEITYAEVLAGGLRVIDLTATALCMDNRVPTLVFGLDDPENIYRAAQGEAIGTLIK